MSQADVEMLRAAYAAINRRDWDAAMVHADPDLEWITPDRVLFARTYRGADEIRRYFEDQWEPFEDVQIELEEFFESGDRIVVFLLARLRPRGSTAVVENRIAQLWTVRDGIATRCEVFPERDKALEAAGIRT